MRIAEQPIIDMSKVVDIARMDNVLFRSMANGMLSNFPKNRQMFVSACEEKDWGLVCRLLHKWKGETANLGGIRLWYHISRVECKPDQLADPILRGKLERDLEDFVAALNAHVR